MTEIFREGEHYVIALDGKPCAGILAAAGASDTFTVIDDGVWSWHRHPDTPRDHKRMGLWCRGEGDCARVQSVSYNGDGWGGAAEYVGDFAGDGTP